MHVASDVTYTDASQTITRTFGRISPEYYRLTTEFETLQVTPEHPLWIQGKGWTKVKDIARGDVLATATGDTLVLNNLHIQQPLRVHNFSVATTPSYFVGESGVWVHNAGNKECDISGRNSEGNDASGGGDGGAKDIGDLFKGGRTPKASELKRYAEQQGWKLSQTTNGPLKYTDENGIIRLTIKQGSSRAPGSGSPHVELRNASGQRVDPAGNPVTRKSPGNHTPIDFDL